jgi:hypothetical protein
MNYIPEVIVYRSWDNSHHQIGIGFYQSKYYKVRKKYKVLQGKKTMKNISLSQKWKICWTYKRGSSHQRLHQQYPTKT